MSASLIITFRAAYRHEKIDFWENVYGFDMSCIRNLAMAEPLVDTVDREQIATTTCPLLTIDIMTVQKSDLAFTVSLLFLYWMQMQDTQRTRGLNQPIPCRCPLS